MADPRSVLDVIRQRADNATDGPWEGEEFSNAVVAPAIGLSDDGVRHSGVAEDVYTAEDREFIIAARSDVPRLVAALTAVLDEADAHDMLAEQFLPDGMRTAHRLAARGIRGAIEAALTEEEND